MFTDKHHSLRGVFSCVLGAAGVGTLIHAIVRVYLADGDVPQAQTISLALALIYGVAGLAVGIWMMFRRDVFRFFPVLGVSINSLLIVFITGLLLWGNI